MNDQIRAIFDISGFLTILRVQDLCDDRLSRADQA